ncbi:MAG: M23 family metallopeptidase [Solirubrobacteraceae bacterium]|nr:M23 family metallopeptidase [Solirubrobacteraceae bacterium]
MAGVRRRPDSGGRSGHNFAGVTSRRTGPTAAATLLVAAAILPASPGAAAARKPSWQPPLERARVASPFAFDRALPYEAGQRRVARLAGAPGETVRAPCPGRVTFAGPLPRGRGLTIRCGRLAATLTGLGAVSARRGTAVVAGQPVGRLGSRGVVRLGARVAGSRHGYLDPLALLGSGSRPRAPLAPAARRGRPPRPRARHAGPRTGSLPGAAILMGAAWLGLGLAGSALGIGIALRRPSAAGAPAVRARHAGR